MSNKKSMKAEQMRMHIHRCGSGMQTVDQYCKEQGLSKATYYYWHKRLQQDATGFVALNIRDEQSDVGIEMRFPNGVSICFNGKVEVSFLKELVCCIY